MQAEGANTVVRQLSISLVTETYPPEVNGVAMTLQRLVAGLSRNGHRLSLVRPQSARGEADYDDQGIQVTPVAGIRLPQYPDLQFGMPAGRRLIRHWQTERPDVVYIATEGPLGFSALRSARRLDIPVVSGFHTNFHSYSRHYHLGIMMPAIERYLRYFHRRTTCTLAPTADLCEHLITRGFGQVRVLPRGVDTRLYHPDKRSPALRRDWAVADDELVALYVGRVAAEKSVEQTLEAFRRIQTRRPGARLVVVGDGPLRETLQAANPDVIFTGMQTGEPLAEHYASADLFLFPSRTETFGNVTLEAMASGLPVVAYDYAAAAMHIRDHENGLRVPFDAPEAFAAAAEQAVTDIAGLRAMGKAARAHTASLGWDQIVGRFEAILTENIHPELSAHVSHV